MDEQNVSITSPHACQGGCLEDNTSMGEFDPQVEERLLDIDVNEESQGSSIEVVLHMVNEF